jgi:hypothetical protein
VPLRYEALGTLAFAYAQRSLVSVYTDEADLDVIIVWHRPAVPADVRRTIIGPPLVLQCGKAWA